MSTKAFGERSIGDARDGVGDTATGIASVGVPQNDEWRRLFLQLF